MSTSELFLYEHPVSSYAQKVKIALRQKNIPFKPEIPPSLSTTEKNTTFDVINPRSEVPVLIDGEARIFQSSIILEYLEERYPDPPLLPPRTDPVARAKVRMIAEVCDTQYEAINWGLGELKWMKRAESNKDLEAAMINEAGKQIQKIQAWLSEQLGSADWFGGNDFGLADVAAAPIVNRSVYYNMGPDKSSALGRWHARICKIPSVAQTFAEFDAGAAKMDGSFAELFRSGQRKREYRDHRLESMIKSGGIDIVAEGLKRNNIKFSWPDGR